MGGLAGRFALEEMMDTTTRRVRFSTETPAHEYDGIVVNGIFHPQPVNEYMLSRMLENLKSYGDKSIPEASPYL